MVETYKIMLTHFNLMACFKHNSTYWNMVLDTKYLLTNRNQTGSASSWVLVSLVVIDRPNATNLMQPHSENKHGTANSIPQLHCKGLSRSYFSPLHFPGVLFLLFIVLWWQGAEVNGWSFVKENKGIKSVQHLFLCALSLTLSLSPYIPIFQSCLWSADWGVSLTLACPN